MKLVKTLAGLPIADSQGISAPAVEGTSEAAATVASNVHVEEPGDRSQIKLFGWRSLNKGNHLI